MDEKCFAIFERVVIEKGYFWYFELLYLKWMSVWTWLYANMIDVLNWTEWDIDRMLTVGKTRHALGIQTVSVQGCP